jgi:hypothetical protein
MQARYRPSSAADQEKASNVEDPPEHQGPTPAAIPTAMIAATGVDNFDAQLARTIANRDEWSEGLEKS